MNIISSGSDDPVSGNDYLGIRPEHIEISEQGMLTRVISCDYHGADTIVLAAVSGQGNNKSGSKYVIRGTPCLHPASQ